MYNPMCFVKMVVVFLLSLSMQGCKQGDSYDYWVLHPAELDKKYSECQQYDAPNCAQVKRAAHDIGELIYEQTTAPESFGKKILALQDSIQKMHAENTEAARESYNEQLKKLQIMYAIVALHGPE